MLLCICVRGTNIVVSFCESVLSTEDGKIFSGQVPVESMVVFNSERLPGRITRRELIDVAIAIVQLGYEEAQARANLTDPYVPFENLVRSLSEPIVRTIGVLQRMPSEENGAVSLAEKLLRAFKRLRRSGQNAFDMANKEAVA